MSSEGKLIERVRRKLPSRTGGDLFLGIGDDAAVLRNRGHAEWVLTTDAFLEGVHFLPAIHPAKSAGYKALARATSDLAAMGARPSCFLLSLALPAARTGKWLDHFLGGMSLAARKFGLVLAGGDTTKYPRVVVNLTVLGKVAPGRAILRSGARPGDLLCVSGRLGQAEMGLRLLRLGLHGKLRWKKLLQKHLHPEPRLAMGEWLASEGWATAMIDTSDGLSTDLTHLCEASGVGARVWSEKIPKAHLPKNLAPNELRKLGLDPLHLALHGGDDYELLFTVPRRLEGRLPRAFGGVPIAIIGEMRRGKPILLMDRQGRTKPLRAQGWDPFVERRRR